MNPRKFSFSTYLIGFLFVLVLLSASYYAINSQNFDYSSLTANGTDSPSPTSTPSQRTPIPTQNRPNNPTPSSSQPPSATASITFDGKVFSPELVNVASGGTLTIHNVSDKPLDFASNNHPTHLCNPELNLGVIPAQKTKTVTLKTKITCGIHNNLNPTQLATISVN